MYSVGNHRAAATHFYQKQPVQTTCRLVPSGGVLAFMATFLTVLQRFRGLMIVCVCIGVYLSVRVPSGNFV